MRGVRRLIVEGWRFIPHSYSVVNQLQCLEMLRRGVLSTRQAELIAQASWSVLPDALAQFEELVLRRVGEQTDAELRKTIQRSAIQVLSGFRFHFTEIL